MGGALLPLVLLIASAPGFAEPGTFGPDGATTAPPEESRPSQTPDGSTPQASSQDPGARWLDEVRAQRQAWEDRRKANREAFEARRRIADPWGSAQHDAWEDEVKRRRETRRQQREQEWDRFRGAGPYQPQHPWPEGIEPPSGYPPPAAPGSLPGDQMTLHRAPSILSEPQGPGIVYPPQVPPRGLYAPPDWDNLWYYRGY
jgi:hypothetical protein